MDQWLHLGLLSLTQSDNCYRFTYQLEDPHIGFTTK